MPIPSEGKFRSLDRHSRHALHLAADARPQPSRNSALNRKHKLRAGIRPLAALLFRLGPAMNLHGFIPGHVLPRRNVQVMGITSAPSKDVWNDEIKEAWTRAYASASEDPVEYEITSIDGSIPHDLRGTIFRNGPGNFERGGQRYKHVLDGDGLLGKFSIDGTTGRARYASRFVATPEYVQERHTDKIVHRNTFGTQPPGILANLGKVALKNPANTNIQFSWGGKCLALWEAALPSRIDPKTLSYMGSESFDGMLPSGSLTVTTGLGAEIDSALGLGVSFTAHPREDRKRNRIVGWAWAASVLDSSLRCTIYEWDAVSGEVIHSTAETLQSPVAPHDFALTDNYYVFALNGMDLKLLPFVLGFTGPVGALFTTGEGVVLQLIPRPDGDRAGTKAVTIDTGDPYFAIHHAAALEEITSSDVAPVLRLYTAAWPRVGAGPFLGDWGGAVPLFDDGRINPTQLLETVIHFTENGTPIVKQEPVAKKACIDHPHVDPRFDGDSRVRYIYMSYCNAEGNSGSPPVGWARWDRQEDKMVVWHAPPRTFCEEIVVIPKPNSNNDLDEARVWIAGMMFDADTDRSCLAILDGANIEAGPICKLWLHSHVPHGLHGSYTPELFGDL